MPDRRRSSHGDLRFEPLMPARWDDLEKLFGKHGAYGGCWCMYWRITRSQFAKNGGAGNRKAFRRIVDSGEVTGILAYEGDVAVGWCSVAPRETFPSLERSRVLKRLDDRPVWSIVCFYVAKSHRGAGVSRALIRAAVDFVRTKGGQIVEAYPTCPKDDPLPPVSSYMGLPSMFEQEGFRICARPSDRKAVVRYEIPES